MANDYISQLMLVFACFYAGLGNSQKLRCKSLDAVDSDPTVQSQLQFFFCFQNFALSAVFPRVFFAFSDLVAFLSPPSLMGSVVFRLPSSIPLRQISSSQAAPELFCRVAFHNFAPDELNLPQTSNRTSHYRPVIFEFDDSRAVARHVCPAEGETE